MDPRYDTHCAARQRGGWAAIPVCRVPAGLETAGYSTLEVAEMLDQAELVHLSWFPVPAQCPMVPDMVRS